MAPSAVLDALERATNAHDLDALVDCFTPDYVNETPVHPARGFRGREQVRANWQQIFAGVPDLRARVLHRAVEGGTVWSEWEMSGTRRDGAQHLLRGVVVFEVDGDRARSARFYLEPVDHAGDGIDAVVRATVGTTS